MPAQKRPCVYVNGDIVPGDEATVSVFDSGFNFADGVFEGIRVYNGRAFRLDEHIHRLSSSAKAFDLTVPLDEAGLTREIETYVKECGAVDDFHIRPILTRGVRFPPRMDPRLSAGPETFVIVGGQTQARGVNSLSATVSSLRRPPPDVFDARIKSLNYGSNLLARLEAQRRGMDDALVLDYSGFLAEATVSNLMVVHGDTVSTPRPVACLDGITRRIVIKLALEQGLTTVERDISRAELHSASELLLTGSAAEVQAVTTLDGSAIGSGAPGPITLALADGYYALTDRESRHAPHK